MKPLVVGLAMEKGLVKPESLIDTAPGKVNMYGMTVTDAHPHGVLSVSEVIQKSSNIGTVKIAMKMPPKDMWEMYTQVGFGQKPQVPFPGAVSGKLRAYKTWRPIEQATMSYGYGLSVSLFQLAHEVGPRVLRRGRRGRRPPWMQRRTRRRWWRGIWRSRPGWRR